MAGTLLLVWVLTTFSNSTVPWADAVTTVLSLLATWGQTRKKVECWWLWIAADVIYVPLYAYKDLWLTAILYVGFMALCVLGLRNWTRSLREDERERAGDRAQPAEARARRLDLLARGDRLEPRAGLRLHPRRGMARQLDRGGSP